MLRSSPTRNLGAHEEEILLAVQRLGFLDRKAIQREWFGSPQAAQRALSRLVREGRLRRTMRGGPAVYHTARWEAQAGHKAAVAAALLALHPTVWRREVPLPGVRGKADALMVMSGARRLWLEVQNLDHGHGASKVRLYRECCRRSRMIYPHSIFPDLLIVGMGERANAEARRAMEGETGFRLFLSLEEVR